jgi:hypothetical protein
MQVDVAAPLGLLEQPHDLRSMAVCAQWRCAQSEGAVGTLHSETRKPKQGTLQGVEARASDGCKRAEGACRAGRGEAGRARGGERCVSR